MVARQCGYSRQRHRTASAVKLTSEELGAGLLPFPVTPCLEDDLTVLVVVVVSIFFTVGFGSFLFSGWVFLSLSISENMKVNVRLITRLVNTGFKLSVAGTCYALVWITQLRMESDGALLLMFLLDLVRPLGPQHPLLCSTSCLSLARAACVPIDTAWAELQVFCIAVAGLSFLSQKVSSVSPGMELVHALKHDVRIERFCNMPQWNTC